MLGEFQQQQKARYHTTADEYSLPAMADTSAYCASSILNSCCTALLYSTCAILLIAFAARCVTCKFHPLQVLSLARANGVQSAINPEDDTRFAELW